MGAYRNSQKNRHKELLMAAGAIFPTTLRRIWCNVMAAMFSLIIIVPITFMLLSRDVPMTAYYYNITSPAEPGQEVSVTWTATMFRYCAGELERKIVDSGGFVFPADGIKIESFDYLTADHKVKDDFTKSFVLPPNMLPGPATYETKMKMWCNPLQELFWPIVYKSNKLMFIVVPSDKKPIPGKVTSLP